MGRRGEQRRDKTIQEHNKEEIDQGKKEKK